MQIFYTENAKNIVAEPQKVLIMKVEAYNIETKEEFELEVNIEYSVNYSDIFLARTYITAHGDSEIEKIVVNKIKHIAFGAFIYHGTTYDVQVAYFIDSENKVALTPYLLDAGMSGFVAPIEFGLAHFLLDYKSYRELTELAGQPIEKFQSYVTRAEDEEEFHVFYKLTYPDKNPELIDKTEYLKRMG